LKTGLLSILLCPICKHFPLKLTIFKWETNTETFEQLKSVVNDKNIEQLRNKVNIKISKTSEEIKIRDMIIRKERDFNSYIEELKKIIGDIFSIQDDSKTYSKEILSVIKKELFGIIKNIKIEEDFKKQLDFFERIKFFIYLANWYLFVAEIEEGIMICNKCKRWYPIIETIPQMWPDEIRHEKTDTDFLKKWKILIDIQILDSGKPFNLK